MSYASFHFFFNFALTSITNTIPMEMTYAYSLRKPFYLYLPET